MRFNVRVTTDLGTNYLPNVTLSQLKGFVRSMTGRGYKTHKTYKPTSKFLVDVRANRGLGLIKSTVRDFETVQIYMTKA